MSESKPDQSLDKGVKAPNVSEIAKEEMEGSMQHETHSHKETHGLRDDIDANTPISDVKGPSVFERVKEELEAINVSIRPRKQDKNQDSTPNDERDDAKFTGSNNERQSSFADEGVNAPNVSEITKEEMEAPVHTEKNPFHNHKETHGLRDDIDMNTPISDVKGPNVFERVKEEFEAIAESIHPRKQDKNQDSSPKEERDGAKITRPKHETQSSLAEEKSAGGDHKETPVKSPSGHHKETHGRGEDIDVNTPISEFRGPSIFHRAKEEFEAIVDTIHHKKESDHNGLTPKKESGFRATISRKLERIITPKRHNHTPKSQNRD